jgi:hypothetical protein
MEMLRGEKEKILNVVKVVKQRPGTLLKTHDLIACLFSLNKKRTVVST